MHIITRSRAVAWCNKSPHDGAARRHVVCEAGSRPLRNDRRTTSAATLVRHLWPGTTCICLPHLRRCVWIHISAAISVRHSSNRWTAGFASPRETRPVYGTYLWVGNRWGREGWGL